jgi:thiamine biosynthesis lipoprotein
MGQYDQGTEAAMEALDRVEALEARLSYFQPTSEVSQWNRLAVEEPVEVEPDLFRLLESALAWHRQTDGAYDIAATALWKVWGFARRAGKVPLAEELAQAMECSGSRYVELDSPRRTIRLLRKGVEINLGSVGKGYALDSAAEVLAQKGVGDFLIHGGQSSVIGRGSRLVDGSRGWSVGIQHPLRPGVRIGEVWLRDRALGTSGAAHQSFVYQGKRYGHILDPRSGRPAEEVLSATVLSPSAAEADALSTAFYVLGKDRATDYCREHPQLATILLCPSKGGRGYDIHTCGLEPDEIRWTETNVSP